MVIQNNGYHTDPWWYKRISPTTGTCTAGTTNGYKILPQLTAGQSYTYRAFSDANCTAANQISSYTFTAVSFSRVSGTNSSRTFRIDHLPQGTQWWWESSDPDGNYDQTCTATTNSEFTLNLQSGFRQFVIRAFSASGCLWKDQIYDYHGAKGGPPKLTAENLAQTSVTLKTNIETKWQHIRTKPSLSTCSTQIPAGTKTANLTGLSPSTSYTYRSLLVTWGCNHTYNPNPGYTVNFATLPAAPGKPTATPSSNNSSVALSWTPNSTGGSAIDKWQYIKKAGAGDWDTTWTDMTGSGASTTSYTVPNLNPATAYKFKVRANNEDSAGGAGAASVESDSATTHNYSFAASAVTSSTATLTLGNYSGAWYHKRTVPSGGTCSSQIASGTTTASLTSLNADTSYTYAAYSDSTCATVLATANSFKTLMVKTTGVSASSGAGSGKLSVSWTAVTGAAGYEVQWKSGAQNYASSRQMSVTTNSAELSSLTNATEYTLRVRATKTGNTGEWSDDAKGTPNAPALSASKVTSTTATLTLAHHTGNWYYKYNSPPGGSCSSNAVSGATVDLTGLDSAQTYTYAAYSDATCATLVATAASFTTLMAKTTGVTASSGAGSGKLSVSWTAVTGATGYDVQWKSGAEEYASSRESSPTTNSAELSNLTDATEYTLRVRATKTGNTGEWSDDAKGTPNAPALAASSVEAATATLTISHHTGNWYYKANAAPHASCSSSAVTGTTEDLTGLSSNTSYTYKAYSDSSCATEVTGDSTDADFLTKPGKPAKPTAATGAGGGKLTLSSSVTGSGTLTKWQYKQKKGTNEYDADWTDISSTSTSLSHTLSGLTNGTDYQYKVRAVNASGDGAESDASTAVQPAFPTLAASAVTSSTATLTIANHSGDWYYKYTTPSNGTCSSKVASGTTAASLTGLDADTSHVFKAYSDATCSTELATAASFTTLMAKTTGVSVLPGVGSGKLLVSWTAGTGATGYDVQWKSGAEEYASSRQSSVTTNSAELSNLTNSTEYTVRVRATKTGNTGNTGEWSDDAKGTPISSSITLAASAITSSTATLTLGNHSGAWYHKRASPTGGACSSQIASGTTTASLSSLNADTSYAWAAYSDSNCSTVLAAVPFTTLMAKVTFRFVGAHGTDGVFVFQNSVTGATGYDIQWKSGTQEYSSSRQTNPNSFSGGVIISGLTKDTQYTVRARATKTGNTGEWSDDATATPDTPAILIGGVRPADSTINFQLRNFGGGADRVNERSSNGSSFCRAVPFWTGGHSQVNDKYFLAGYVEDQTYTLELMPHGDTDCSSTAVASVTFSFSYPTLTASAVGATTATLTIGSPMQEWWYKGDHSGAVCTAAAAFASMANVTSLTAETSYVFTAYDNANCTETSPLYLFRYPTASFTTLMAKTTGVTASSGAGSGKLSVSWIAVTGATGYDVQWKSGAEEYASSRESSPTTNSAELSNLTDGTEYTLRVRATKTGATGEWSDDAKGTPNAPALAASDVEATTATLTVSHHSGNWYYKANAAPDASCSSSAVTGTEKDLTGLSSNTS